MKNQQQEQKKNSLTPWLLGAGALGLGGIGLALANKGKTGSVKNLLDLEKKKQIVKTGAEDAKNLIKDLQNKEEVAQIIKKPGASDYKNIPLNERQAIIQRRRLALNKAAADENVKTIGAEASHKKNKRIVESLVAGGDYSRNIYFLCDF